MNSLSRNIAKRLLAPFFFLFVFLCFGQTLAEAASVTLNWTDNSNNENGFNIERKTGTTGAFAQIATVGSNSTSYVDSSVAAGTTYCYRVTAFNSTGVSPYSNQACATTAPIQTFTLSISKTGSGSGTVTASPANINCGGTCAADYNSNQLVNLFAAPAVGSIFAGWSGNADCANGSVTMNASKSCTATFNTGASNPLAGNSEDVNGDTKADLILRDTNNAFWVSESTGSEFTRPALWLQHGGEYLEGQAQYADLNGDGKTDLIFQGLDNRFWVSLSTGVGFAPGELWVQHGWWFVEGQAQYADLNGDGKADLIFQGLDNRFWVSLSTGVGFAPGELWVQHGEWFENGQAQYADLNGDGKTDLIFHRSDSTVWVNLSTGTGFTAVQLWLQF